MSELQDLNTYGSELRTTLLLKTSPVAIKLLKKETEIPEAAIRPKRDLGYHLALCQGIAMARREGSMVAMEKLDHWCYVPVIALGHAKTPKFVLDGNMLYPNRITDLEAAKRVAKEKVHLEYGKYTAIVMAPLETTTFKPDFVIIYCNPSQLRFLLGALSHKDGYRVTTTLEPGSACVNAIVPVIQNGDCKVTVLCAGDIRLAIAQDDELILSVPCEKLEDMMAGVRHIYAAGFGLPIKYAMRMENTLFENYRKVGKMIGLEM